MGKLKKSIYEDGKIEIGISGIETNGHDLFIGKDYYLLARGILDDMSHMGTTQLKGSINAYNSMILRSLDQVKISVSEFGWALAKAKVSQLEEDLYSSH